jgi:hypothetical protein
MDFFLLRRGLLAFSFFLLLIHFCGLLMDCAEATLVGYKWAEFQPTFDTKCSKKPSPLYITSALEASSLPKP